MELFQDQGLIKLVVVGLAVLLAWWVFRWAFGWAKRLSRLGCMAILAVVVIVAVVSRLG
ncbi:MAG TPA: hypothetical protein VLL77_00445 [Anaerolineales bacterium]|nr:hypothetical protein [Anaerolineales bacterium]